MEGKLTLILGNLDFFEKYSVDEDIFGEKDYDLTCLIEENESYIQLLEKKEEINK